MRFLFSLPHHLATESDIRQIRKGITVTTELSTPTRCSTCGNDGDCPDCGLCACGAVATLIVRERSCEAHICDRCFQADYENNYENSRAWTVEPLAADPPAPEPNPLGGDEGDTLPSAHPRAVTLTSILIDQASQRNRLCPNCEGAHFGWQCPAIHARLFAPEPAPWSDLDLGRELWRMRWHRYAAFLTLIRSVPTAHLVIYAASYQAFVRSINASTDLQINDILRVWAQMLGGRAQAAA
jgi:hypothetical protein